MSKLTFVEQFDMEVEQLRKLAKPLLAIEQQAATRITPPEPRYAGVSAFVRFWLADRSFGLETEGYTNNSACVRSVWRGGDKIGQRASIPALYRLATEAMECDELTLATLKRREMDREQANPVQLRRTVRR